LNPYSSIRAVAGDDIINHAAISRQLHRDIAVKTAEVIELQGIQAIKLPEEFRFAGTSVSIRKAGEAVILEPVKPAQWPVGFFEEIRIDDPEFKRPDQGQTPPAPILD
jgi:virulence-associated protein VagC